MIFHRAQLVEVLYDGLPSEAKARYLLNKKLAHIDSLSHGVRLTCTDGSEFEGSIVLGADGVHSATRTQMRELALAENPRSEVNDATPFPAQYRCMWCSFPRPVVSGLATDAQSKDRSIMFLSGRERGWIFLYERLPEPTTARARYTEADRQAFAAEFADFPVSETLKVKDVYATRLTEGMANLEEGILKHWSWGRIVLAGDACHKYTPNAGRGLNNGIQDVVALCNGLHKMVKSMPNASPSVGALDKVFAEYQMIRATPLQGDANQSRYVSRMHAWANPLYYFMARYVMSLDWFTSLMLNFLAARTIRKALVLDYVAVDEPYPALVRWEHPLMNKHID